MSLPLRSPLARAAAHWLIVVIIFPFTAPFSTCDLADLQPGPVERLSVPFSSAPRSESLVHAALTSALPTLPERARYGREATSERPVGTLAFSPRVATLDPRAIATDPEVQRPIAKTVLRI